MRRDANPWPEVPLASVCAKITDGTHHSPRMTSSGYLYVTSKNIRPFKIELKDRLFVSEADHMEIYARCDVKPGDVLLTKDGANTGNAAINTLEEEFSLLSSVALIRPDSSKLNSGFLCQFLNSGKGRAQTTSAMDGLAIRRLTIEKIKQLRIPLPSFAEQCKITSILSSIDYSVEKTQAVINQLEVVKKALLGELLARGIPGYHSSFVQSRVGTLPATWRLVEVAEIAADESNSFVIGPFGSNLVAADYRNQGTPVVFVRDIKPNRFIWKSNVFVDPEKARSLRAHQVRPGDVVITKMGLPAGVAAVYPAEMPEGVVTADIIRIRPDPTKIDADFLALTLNSNGVMGEVEKITGGQTRPKLTLRDYRTIPIPLPPLEEQTQIARTLGGVETRISVERRTLESQMHLKQGLLQALLSGQVRAPVSTQEAA